jgi:hypothetical protein
MAIKFADLRQRRKSHLDVPVPAWEGVARLRKLNACQMLWLNDFAKDFERDDRGHFVKDDESWAFGVEMLAMSIVDDDDALQFATEDGRDYLRTESIGVIGTLVAAAMELNEIGTATVDAAKKN